MRGDWATELSQLWDEMQTGFLPQREARFDVVIDALRDSLGPEFTVLDMGCGLGSFGRRILDRIDGAQVIGVDRDPVLMAIGKTALSDHRDRMRWVDADFRIDGWAERIGVDVVDAAISTTALHWLSPDELLSTYRRLGRLIRQGGIIINADNMPYDPSAEATAHRLAARRWTADLTEAFDRRALISWEAWWARAEAEPALRETVTERSRRRGAEPQHHDHTPLALHQRGMHDAGFDEVVTLWQRLDDRVLLGVKNATTGESAPPPRASVAVGVGPVTVDDVVAVARRGAAVRVSPEALAAVADTRSRIEALVDSPTPVYGVSTGFGALATRHIPRDRRTQLQRSLIRSHAAGSGPEVEQEVVRAMMLLRLSTLATGRTGVRPATVQAYANLLSSGLTPVVFEYGSLGCSGDLAPLAHVALALIGEGRVRAANGELRPAGDALVDCGLAPVVLAEKEGLALINGTDGMLGHLVLALRDLDGLLVLADIAAAMSVEGLLGTDRVFAAELQALRPHPGQALAASNMRRLLADSAIVASHRIPDCPIVQDAYSLRCAPQVAGAVRDTLEHARVVAAREMNSAIDNPVVTLDGRVESNGNFHGAPVAYVLDFLAIAAADLASMSERRTDRFLDPTRSHGLNPFLADQPGEDSGHMIAQYTQAGIVSELKRLAAPASVDSIPSSAMQEDHVSMGWSAGRKLRRSIDGLTRVLAIEVLTAARAIDLRAPLAPAPATGAVVAAVRKHVEGPGTDRYLAPEIESVVMLARTGELVAAAVDVTGPLS